MFQFTSTCPAVTTMLILTFAITLTITLGQEDTESAFQYLGPGYTYKYIEPSPTENFYPSQNVMECAMKSLYSGSRFFSYHKVSRLCKNYSARRKVTMSTTQDSNEISFYRVEDWMKVYAISRGTGSDVRNSFLGYGTPSSWNVDKCKDNICPNFFRHPLLDTWDSLQIDEVKLVLYKNQTPVLNMVFNGRNTTRKNWFSFENLKSSPWNDLNQGMAEVFSINGNHYNRFFYIGGYGSCATDYGWFTILQMDQACQYERKQYPAFIYSNTSSMVRWSEGHATADSMAVFLHIKPE